MDNSKMEIQYSASVLVGAGWRPVSILATARMISAKKCKVLNVVKIDGKIVGGYQSRTGSNRQKFDTSYIADREKDAVKIVSKLQILKGPGE